MPRSASTRSFAGMLYLLAFPYCTLTAVAAGFRSPLRFVSSPPVDQSITEGLQALEQSDAGDASGLFLPGGGVARTLFLDLKTVCAVVYTWIFECIFRVMRHYLALLLLLPRGHLSNGDRPALQRCAWRTSACPVTPAPMRWTLVCKSTWVPWIFKLILMPGGSCLQIIHRILPALTSSSRANQLLLRFP